MSESGVRLLLIVAFATSLGLGAGCAWFLVRWTGRSVAWVFAVPLTLWWLVAALSVTVHVFGIRVTPLAERSTPAPGGPLTPRSPLVIETR